ncbi:hypothetical protein F0562_035130 [Nyssa sinensis]|uniref:Late embryogenesis abundant protein LEA-2 subgroup domain-containing protein n=1 Tax=Nyssa sinensis TaxID=561372 RepID=A0A5J5AFJ6_9ASTE|nr:hypothetical protein F0562_035130 [Nyssa sinensis]
MPKSKLFPRKHTNPFTWCGAIICAIIAIAVIITGIVVFVGYLVIRPKVPFISVTYAHLDRFDYDQASLLTTQVTIVVKFENDNARAHASFYDASFIAGFHGVEIAELVADPFDVGKNSSVELNYLVESTPIPLGPEVGDIADMSIKENYVTLDLKGTARTRWRVWILGSVKFWLHMNCGLHFFMNGSSTDLYCSTRSK